MTPTDPRETATAIICRDGGRLLAVLIGLLKRFELAEDCLQDAYAAALVHWVRGVPANPSAWLLHVARRKAIDRMRRTATARAKERELSYLLQIEAEHLEQDDDTIPDERLKLIFTCCHPALERNASVALTLRSLCGLTTEEIARAFLVSRETMAQRIVRAQQKIAKAKIPYDVPDAQQWPARTEAVLSVIYLIFNEAYASSTLDYIRTDLGEEAIRLARVVWQLAPHHAEAAGLLALLLLHRSRFGARINSQGALVPLAHQDRSRWNRDLIAEGTRLLQMALQCGQAGPYQLQAAIAAIHCEAATYEDTDWREIVLIYDRLLQLTENPVIALNRLVAMSYIDEPRTLLPALQALAMELSDYQPFHAALADLLGRCGRHEDAAAAYDKAMQLSTNEAERKFLVGRRAGLVGKA